MFYVNMHGVVGDVGLYDENGYFFIVDRIKELIKVKGFQVNIYFLTTNLCGKLQKFIGPMFI